MLHFLVLTASIAEVERLERSVHAAGTRMDLRHGLGPNVTELRWREASLPALHGSISHP
jgi:hypothetical protein